MFGDFFEELKSINRHHENLNGEFRRLCAEPCMSPVNPGDRVVVAVGFIGMGHPWERMEGVALEVGGGSLRVRLDDKVMGRHTEKWIHPALVVDVFEGETKAVECSE